MKQELQLTKQSISYLEKSNLTKDALITQYEKKDSLNVLVVTGYKEVINNLNRSVVNSEIKYSAQTIKLRRQKFKKWGTLIVGFGLGYLMFK